MADKRPSPFKIALAARRGKIPKDQLSGAARHLYEDKDITNEALELSAGEAKPKKRSMSARFQPVRRRR